MPIESTHGGLAQIDAQVKGKLDLSDTHGAHHIGQTIFEPGFLLGARQVIVMPVDPLQMTGGFVFFAYRVVDADENQGRLLLPTVLWS